MSIKLHDWNRIFKTGHLTIFSTQTFQNVKPQFQVNNISK